MVRPINLLSLAAATWLIGACGNSNPCEATVAAYDCGDCTVPKPAICEPHSATPSQQAACKAACSDSADQAALINYVECNNTIPSTVGTCSTSSVGGEKAWYANVVEMVLGCEATYLTQLSNDCVKGYLALLDGGFPDGG